MENINTYSNSEILKMISNLSQNHEKVKHEIIMLHEILKTIEKEYVELTDELKNRK